MKFYDEEDNLISTPEQGKAYAARCQAKDSIPHRAFLCPKCKDVSIRMWPHADGGNWCNDCGEDMKELA